MTPVVIRFKKITSKVLVREISSIMIRLDRDTYIGHLPRPSINELIRKIENSLGKGSLLFAEFQSKTWNFQSWGPEYGIGTEYGNILPFLKIPLDAKE